MKKNLEMQGFDFSNPDVQAAAQWLRFTPSVTLLLLVIGVALRSPMLLGIVAAAALLGAAGWHPVDFLYDIELRHLLGGPKLPASQAPRRFSMVIAGTWSAVVAVLFARGQVTAGLIAGAMLIGASALVATMQFCVGSWMYQLIKGMTRGREVTLGTGLPVQRSN